MHYLLFPNICANVPPDPKMLPAENWSDGAKTFCVLAFLEKALACVGPENELDEERVWLQGPPKQL